MDAELKGVLIGAALGGGVGLLLGFGIGLALADHAQSEGLAEAAATRRRRDRRPELLQPPVVLGDGGGIGPPRMPRESPPDKKSMPRREHVIIQRENFTTNQSFVFHEPGVSMPVSGPGTLVDGLIVCDSDDFTATVTADGQQIISETFATLEQLSQELDRISAYRRAEDGKYVFSIGDYEFQQSVEIAIQPGEQIGFDVQRAEIDIVRGG